MPVAEQENGSRTTRLALTARVKRGAFPVLIISDSCLYLFTGRSGRSSNVRVQRGPSDYSSTSPEGVGRLFFTARVERPPSI